MNHKEEVFLNDSCVIDPKKHTCLIDLLNLINNPPSSAQVSMIHLEYTFKGEGGNMKSTSKSINLIPNPWLVQWYIYRVQQTFYGNV